MSTAALEVQEKLCDLGGGGPLKDKILTARSRLVRVNNKRWQTAQAPGRIWRFLHLRQRPKIEEVEDVRAAHARFCLEEIEANREANRRLAAEFVAYVEKANRIDQDFFGPQIEAMRARLNGLGVKVPGGD